jgi:zinc protease
MMHAQRFVGGPWRTCAMWCASACVVWTTACGGAQSGAQSGSSAPSSTSSVKTPASAEAGSGPAGSQCAACAGCAKGQATCGVKPPPSATPKDVRFPPVARGTLSNGLEVNTATWSVLPIVNVVLVIKGGESNDPKGLPGVAHVVASMLKEGTKKRNSEKLAESIEFLGATLHVRATEDAVIISMHTLKQHLPTALSILSEVVTQPSFDDVELAKLKRRELDRLALAANDPGFLVMREFYKGVYGDHPYGTVDTTPEALAQINRDRLVQWHKQYVVPSNAFFVVVGDVQPEAAESSIQRAFASWSKGSAPRISHAAPPTRSTREVVIVNRPSSVQTVLWMGNLALPRSNPDYIPMLVANQVLGGSAASRLFMDLREKRSLTYGAYSSVGTRLDVAPFLARASVRTAVTAEAMQAFMEHLQSMVNKPVPETELAEAKRYLSDSFPLRMDTPAEIASHIAELRLYGLADDYWDTFRSKIRAVTAQQVLEASRKYIQPERMLVVAVGKASDIEKPLSRYGKVTRVESKPERR